MRKKNFILRVAVCVICMCVLLQPLTFAFSDVDEASTAGKAIMKMQEKGYIQGFGDGTFRPNATLTRAEFVTIINKMYNYTVEAENVFTDVKQDDWFCKDVLAAFCAGYIKGMGDGRFAPNEPVTREQVCVMLNSILNMEKLPFSQQVTDKISDWAKESVEKVISNRLFSLESGGKFRGTEAITRSEVCVALEKCIIDVDYDVEIEPIDLDSIARDELERRLKRIIECMENVIIPTYTFPETVRVGNMVVESMKKYLADESYDYVSAANETYEVYRLFNGAKAREFKSAIYENIPVEDLAILFDFFYTPEMNFSV